jgi:hypothetical protein
MGNSGDLGIELTDGSTQASPLRGNCCERARRGAVEWQNPLCAIFFEYSRNRQLQSGASSPDWY